MLPRTTTQHGPRPGPSHREQLIWKTAGVLGREWPLLVNWATTALFLLFGPSWVGDLSNPGWFAFMFLWPFAVILLSAFALVRHAERLALVLGEPLGTRLNAVGHGH